MGLHAKKMGPGDYRLKVVPQGMESREMSGV